MQFAPKFKEFYAESENINKELKIKNCRKDVPFANHLFVVLFVVMYCIVLFLH
jgi:hypothetical protein